MGFGQYSSESQARRSKRQMVEETGADPRTSKIIARNTLRYADPVNGATVYRYHDTDVYRREPDGTRYLDTGGWNTLTTRDRMNMALAGSGFAVVTHRGSLYLVDHRGAAGPWSDGRKMHEFVQRARIGPRGGVKTDADGPDGVAVYDSVRPLVDRYIAKMCADGIPTDTSGDPWSAPRTPGGLYDRDLVLLWLGDPDTARKWHDDAPAGPYVFGTFVYHALRWSGLTDTGVAYWVQDFNAGRGDRQRVTGKVRRYIRACLGYASS